MKSLSSEAINLLRTSGRTGSKAITDEHYTYEVRGKAVEGNNYVESMSHQKVPKIAAPTMKSWGELLIFLMKENLLGAYHPAYRRHLFRPPHRRRSAAHVRGRGHAGAHQPPLPLSVARTEIARACRPHSIPVTPYGEDPHPRPDIYGKIGNSGVNVPTLDDMKKLYSDSICRRRTRRCR